MPFGGSGFNVQVTGNAFKIFAKAARDAQKHIMKAVMKSALLVQRGAKINVKQVLNTTDASTGTLGRSITVEAKPAQLAAHIGPTVIYGRIHELGGTIHPIKSDKLYLQRDGDIFATAAQVTIKKRPYLQPALDDATPAIDMIFMGEIEPLFEG